MAKTTETNPISASRHAVTKRAVIHHLAVELSETAKLALPMALTQLGQIAIMSIDLAIIGRAGSEAVAAVALAGRVYFVGVAFGMGLLGAIAAFAAQAFGANNLDVARRSLRMGLWAALVLSVPIIAFGLCGERILLALGQNPGAVRLAQQYLLGLTWGAAPALWFQVIRSFMGAVNRPQPVLWITLAAIPANALLVYLLMYGKLGLPRLEVFGAGLAITLVNCAMFLAGLWFATMHRPFRDYHVFARIWRFDWPLMRELIVIGMPISIASLIESGLYSAASLLAGLISTSALAAHQIAYQVLAIPFMISFGVSMTAAVRVGHGVGRNDGPGIKRAGVVAMLLGVAVATMLALAVIAARFEIAELFLGESTSDASATIELVATLLLVGASFVVISAVQIIAAGGLRGLKDTRVPLLFAAIAYWLIGLPLSYLLSLKTSLGAIGIWVGLAIGTTVCAGLLVLRFRLLANKFALPIQHFSA
ncbi:MATE family efflux transporter [Bradyrhizobium brasilense]|uniref:MATE family efflux transporter n=1 Tax=Bradyrhizobium brasilense TaxID=1419277 RepID=UPI0028779624|nr:MATE family efflux transporter [Bradyrhizobium brasilense]MCP3415706.1 MATE family efflux transporter [Bradyrhizobium brasilense]